MNCPRCGGELKPDKYLHISVDRCARCSGIWLDEPEMGQLEDEVWSDDESKGTMETHVRPSDIKCPRCNKLMVKFNYRYYDLELDTCPDLHGFWLDNGEEKRIIELIRQDKEHVKRKIKAEDQWAKSIGHLRSRSFIDKIKSLLNR